MTSLPQKSVVCLTGARGIIGKHLLRFLDNQDVELRVLSRSNDFALSGNMTLFKGDVSQADTLLGFLDNCNYLFHCAGEIKDTSKMAATNVNGTRNIVDICKDLSTLEYFCHISSAGVIGKTNELIVTEHTPCNPQNIYEKSKYDAEEIVLKASLHCNVKILRPINIVEETNRGNIEFIFKKNFKSYLKMILFGRENAHIVHSETVAKAALFLATNQNHDGKIYFVSNDHDKKNNFLDIWETVYKTPFSFSFPARVSNWIRKKIGGNNIVISYSSEKLTSLNFNNYLTVEEIVQRLDKT